MAIEVLMPAMSERDGVGRLARWLVAPGDFVRPGDVLAEIETHTATIEVEAVDGGRIARILIASGSDAVAADTPIALIEPDEGGNRQGSGSRSMGGAALYGTDGSHSRSGVSLQDRVKASPLARKRARAAGISLDELDGSGPGGRIIAKDVASAESFTATPRRAHDATANTRVRERESETTVVAMRHAASDRTGTRELSYVGTAFAETALRSARDDDVLAREAYAPGSYIARSHDPRLHDALDRLVTAHSHVPQLTLHAEVRLDELERSLQRMNSCRLASGQRVFSLTVSDVLVKAMGLALRQVSDANVSFTRNAMLHHAAADVAVALLPDLSADFSDHYTTRDMGVMAPVIAHADLKSLSEISEEVQALREMVRSGEIQPSAIRGGVTTIFDLSGSVVSGCETLVLPPQSSVLVMGAAEAKPVVVNGEIVIRPCAQLSLSVDQRAIDTGAAMRLLTAVKVYVEDPMRMLV